MPTVYLSSFLPCSNVVSVRDVLTWAEFMNTTASTLSAAQAFFHGAHLVFLDSLGCGCSLSGGDMKEDSTNHITAVMEKCGGGGGSGESVEEVGSFFSTDTHCGIEPFVIPRGAPWIAVTLSCIDCVN